MPRKAISGKRGLCYTDLQTQHQFVISHGNAQRHAQDHAWFTPSKQVHAHGHAQGTPRLAQPPSSRPGHAQGSPSQQVHAQGMPHATPRSLSPSTTHRVIGVYVYGLKLIREPI